MSKTKITFLSLGILVAIIALAFTLELGSLSWKAFFNPKHAKVEREVFEETKSFVHGKLQDLGNLYNQWNSASVEDRVAIEEVVKLQFAEFDAANIKSDKLKTWLEKVRGY